VLTLYAVALFLHIVGALGVFAALALDWVGITYLRRARTAEQVREWAGIYRIIRVLGGASVGALLMFGLYMTAVSWGPTGWIGVGFISLVAIAALGAASGVGLSRILDATGGGDAPLGQEARARLGAGLYVVSVRARTALALGVVFLMTIKPDGPTSLLVSVIALALGIAAGVPAMRQGLMRAVST
jgi:hypothetical protein